MTVLQPSIFVGRGQEGDFDWMQSQPEHARTLFVFNDNQTQFEEHEYGDHSYCKRGGGNAVIRPLQDESPPRAAGIPTGTFATGGFQSLTPAIRMVIDRALANIRALASSGDYDRVVYSGDGAGSLGTGIFNVGQDVKDYIVAGLTRVVPVEARQRQQRMTETTMKCHECGRETKGALLLR